LAGFQTQDQTRIATAVSEIARNAYQYGSGGRIEFTIAQVPAPSIAIRISDTGRGIADVARILDGRYVSSTGIGIGIGGARRLMDGFEIASDVGRGTTVIMTKHLPRDAPPLDHATIEQVVEALAREMPTDVVGELQRQDREALEAAHEMEARYAEIQRLNQELEETNRGVLALYSELDEKAGLLERANSLKTSFLSDFSHEVRTPLNAVRNLARLLLDGYEGPLTESQCRAVSLMRASAEGLAQLVDDWLDLARIEAGKVLVRPTEFDLTLLFGVLRSVFRPLASSPDVSLVLDDPEGIGPLHTDEGKVSQILRNLISNALKFTLRGSVRVAATAGPDDTIGIHVSDTGIGIAPADLERIFEEFSQVENPVQHHVKGTGLGLPISRKLARMLGGDIAVQSTVDVGTTFTLTIPRVHNDASRPGGMGRYDQAAAMSQSLRRA